MSRIDDLIAEHCPDGVEFRLLGDCIERNLGGGTPSRSRSDYWNGDIPWASVGDVTASSLKIDATRQTITETGLSNSSSNVISTGWVIVAVKIAPGEMRVVEQNVAINQDIRGLQLRQEVDPYYLAYYFQTLDVVGNGTIVKGITNQSLLRISVPVPPLEVQHAIVEVLDTFSKLEAELEAELGAELEARKQQYEHYRHEVLSFSTDTSWGQLSDVVEYTNGKAHEKLADPAGHVAMVTARFISRNGEANRYLKLEDVLTSASVGDVAMVLSDLPKGRALARTFYVDKEDTYAINQRVARLRVKDERRTDPKFVYYFLNRNAGLLRYDNGFDQTHLSKSQVTSLPFPVLSLPEQKRIVGVLGQLDALVNDLGVDLSAELASRRKQYEYYRDNLLTFKELEVME